jgi:DNA-binding response OmpR family regulator
MRLNALLVSRDSHALQVVCAALDERKVGQEVCSSVPDALQLLALQFYSALVVDFDLPGAPHVVHMARMAPPERRPVVFALLSLRANIAETFQCGANFVIYKPVIHEQVSRSLRAGCAFMRADKRRSARHHTQSLVYLRFGDLCPTPALVLDLNQRGLSVQAAEPLPPTRIPLRFMLPGTEFLIEGRGDVIWADDSGRAGILFTELPASSRSQLKQWVGKREKQQAGAPLPQRTIKTRTTSTRPS